MLNAADSVVTIAIKTGAAPPPSDRWPRLQGRTGCRAGWIPSATSWQGRQEFQEPVEPYVLGELVIDYAQRRVNPCRQSGPADLHRVFDPGRALLLRRPRDAVRASAAAGVGCARKGQRGADAHSHNSLRRRLGDDASNLTYIFTEARVGYRMPKGGDKAGFETVRKMAVRDELACAERTAGRGGLSCPRRLID